MKQIVCELCEGTNLKKQDDVFVCADCGIQYSLEEVKKLMVERNDVGYYIELAQQALAEADADGALGHIEEALNIEPDSTKLLLLKQKILVTASTVEKDYLTEIKQTADKILLLANGDNTIILNLLSCYCEKVADSMLKANVYMAKRPDLKLYTAAMYHIREVAEKQFDLLSRGYHNVKIPTINDGYEIGYSEYKKIWSTTNSIFDLTHSFISYIYDIDESLFNKNSEIYEILSQYFTLFEDAYTKYFNLCKTCLSTFKKVPSADTENYHNKRINEYREKSKYYKGKLDAIMAEKQAEINRLFWEKNVTLKKELEEERENISARIPDLTKKVEEINSKYKDELERLYQISVDTVPAEAEADKIKNKIHDIQNELDHTSFFKVKQKKEFEAQISEYGRQLTSLSEESDAQRREVKRNYNDFKYKVEDECKPFNQEIHSIKARISIIENELNKNRTIKEIDNPDDNNFDLDISNTALRELFINTIKRVGTKILTIEKAIAEKSSDSKPVLNSDNLATVVSTTFISFMAFISSADGEVEDEEVQTFSEIIGTDFTAEKVSEIAEIASKHYLEDKKVPEFFAIIFTYAKIAKKMDIDLSDEIIAAYNLYRLMGRKVIMADGAAEPAECEMYSIPLKMIINTANEHDIKLPYDDIVKI